MNTPLQGPGGTYAVRLTVYAPVAPGANLCHRHEVATGTPLTDPSGGPDPDGAPGEFLVALPGILSLRLRPRPEGLTVRDLRVEATGPLTVTARVTALAGAPEWLPDTADYAVFQGDRKAAAALRAMHLPFRPGRPESGTGALVAMDRLVAVLGQAIGRANDRLARTPGAGGTALAASVTVRVAVSAVRVSGRNRVLLTLTRPGEAAAQHVEITMTTVPGAEEAGDP